MILNGTERKGPALGWPNHKKRGTRLMAPLVPLVKAKVKVCAVFRLSPTPVTTCGPRGSRLPDQVSLIL